MPGNGEIFLGQVQELRGVDIGVLATARHFEAQMTNDDANRVEWGAFKERMRPIESTALPHTELECVVIPKTVPWGSEDVTIFVGANDRRVNEIDDLGNSEGESFFGFNFGVARGLVTQAQKRAVQVSIGFNSHDLSPGHHTVLRLHSHIRTINDRDAARRQPLSWQEMDMFSKLSFIEPFAPLHHDFIVNAIQAGTLREFLASAPQARTGYTSLMLRDVHNVEAAFADIKTLYSDMKAEYETIAAIFTAGEVDPVTQKLIPRPPNERTTMLEQYLAMRRGLYSEASVTVLRYLAEHIQPAKLRGYATEISSSAMAYLTRGFAGGITFAFTAGKDTVRFDFMPRVITTSAVTKTMMGQGLPTRIDKTTEPATPEELAVAEAYYRDVRNIISGQ